MANTATSIYFDGTGDGIEIADHPDFNFGNCEWCVEGWVYPSNVSGRNASTHNVFSVTPNIFYFFPVDPNPPEPLSVSSNINTCSHSICSTLFNTNCPIRSPFSSMILLVP